MESYCVSGRNIDVFARHVELWVRPVSIMAVGSNPRIGTGAEEYQRIGAIGKEIIEGKKGRMAGSAVGGVDER